MISDCSVTRPFLCLLIAWGTSLALADTGAVVHLAKTIKTDAGELPSCTPIHSVAEEGEAVAFASMSPRWGEFPVEPERLERWGFDSLSDCLSASPKYKGRVTPEMVADFGDEHISTGMPLEFMSMLLGPMSKPNDWERKDRMLHRWNDALPPTEGARYRTDRSLSFARLRLAQPVFVREVRGEILSIVVREQQPINFSPETHGEGFDDPAVRFDAGMWFHERGEYLKVIEVWAPLVEADHANAQYGIADLYFHGEGVEKDPKKAIELLRRAQYHLGLLYLTGDGVATDLREAYRWMSYAKNHDHEPAAQSLDLLEKQLSREELDATVAHAARFAMTDPVKISASDVVYPELARTARMEGYVVLQARIESDGVISSAEVVSSKRPHVGFEVSALESVMQWKYEPAKRNGEPHAVYFVVQVGFHLAGPGFKR